MKFKLPEGVGGAGFNGESFEAVDGVIEAPAEAVAAFASFGIHPLPEAEPEPAAPLTIAQIKAGIQEADLDALEASEKEGQNRVGVFEVIAVERNRRAEALK